MFGMCNWHALIIRGACWKRLLNMWNGCLGDSQDLKPIAYTMLAEHCENPWREGRVTIGVFPT